jgi:hypothetical protein
MYDAAANLTASTSSGARVTLTTAMVNLSGYGGDDLSPYRTFLLSPLLRPPPRDVRAAPRKSR